MQTIKTLPQTVLISNPIFKIDKKQDFTHAVKILVSLPNPFYPLFSLSCRSKIYDFVDYITTRFTEVSFVELLFDRCLDQIFI